MPVKVPKMTPIDQLYADCLQVESINYDWSDDEGRSKIDFEDSGEGFEFWEGSECQKCGAVLVLHNGGGEETHKDLDPDSECDGWISEVSGPTMSYYYPASFIRDPDDAARMIAHLPLCVVRVDGNFALALTGGGMDLSWEICEAFMRLGQLPPMNWANLPRMAGRGASRRDRWIIAGARASFTVQAKRCNRAKADLRKLKADADAYAAKVK